MRKLKSELLLQKPVMKLWGRDTTLFISLLFGHFAMKTHLKEYDFAVKSVAISQGGITEAFSSEVDMDLIKDHIQKRISDSKTFGEYFERDALLSFGRYLATTKHLEKKYMPLQVNAKNDVLLKDYRIFLDCIFDAQAHIWFIFFSDLVLGDILSQAFHRHSIPLTDNLLKIICSPLKWTGVVTERLELLKIAKKKRRTDAQMLLQKHALKWKWFPCYNPSDTPYDFSYFKQELSKINAAAAKEEYAKILAESVKHKKQFSRCTREIKSPELRKLIIFANKISFYREYRNDVRRIALSRIRGLFACIGEALGLSAEEVCYLTPSEVKGSLAQNRISLSRDEIQERIRLNVVIGDEHTFRILTGPKAEPYLHLLERQKGSQVKGVTACSGKGKGLVMVVTDRKRLKDFKKGSVLVTSMTGPEFVAAIRDASAVVTDEGGISCHAAIVARELKKPCIIGTKIATKVLKDGDIVEVDANSGVVKIITRAGE